MKFKIKTKDLKTKVENLQKVAKAKTPIPICSYFKLEAKDDNLFITASDMEVRMTATSETEEMIETGSVCVPADVFTSTIKSFKDDLVEISSDENNNVLIRSGKGNFNVVGVDADEYPIVKYIEGNSTRLVIPAITLIAAIDKTLAFAGSPSDQFMPQLAGVYIDPKQDSTVFVGTDRHRMGLYGTESVEVSGDFSGVLIPSKMAGILRGALIEDEFVTVLYDSGNIEIETSESIINSVLGEGKYPQYNTVLSAGTSLIIKANIVALTDALKRVSIYSNAKAPIVHLYPEGEAMKVAAENKDFGLNADETVDISSQGEQFPIKLNSKFLIEMLSKIDTDNVEIKAGTGFVLLYPDNETKDYFYLLAGIA